MQTQPAPVEGAPRSVSVLADAARSGELRDAIAADPSLHLAAVEQRFAALVVAVGFPGDVVVLAEEPGRPMLAHARTAVAAGAAVVVHADAEAELLDALEALGAIVLSRAEPPSVVASHVATARRARRRRAAHLQLDPVDRRPRLSSGERRALAHYVQGLTTVQVASEMGVGYETAKTFLRRVRAKYAAVERPAGKRAELIVRAEEDGIL
ncbi:helix-turn-helix transcriptional regulator [Agrococcus sp. DT81.2]|uniref:helix-turn-helix transcriptional regulator n=1 Tax=Agrococcus sp. DT81.2 TaxID=3393414 RepID=UPI003CE53FA6